MASLTLLIPLFAKNSRLGYFLTQITLKGELEPESFSEFIEIFRGVRVGGGSQKARVPADIAKFKKLLTNQAYFLHQEFYS